MDFEADLRREILSALPYDRSDAALADKIARQETRDLLLQFVNWLHRLIHPHPRIVRKSQQYVFRWVPPQEQVYLERIVQKIETGGNLTPHLSRRINQAFAPSVPIKAKKNLAGRRDLDLFLNDWGIHHLHLPDILDKDGFVRRDPLLDKDLLLFAVFRRDVAYLLDVLSHRAWANEGLVEAAVRTWPDARLFLQLNVLGVKAAVDRNDRQKFRAAGVNTFIVVDGKVFVSGTMGLTSAGTAGVTVDRARSLLRTIANLENNLRTSRDFLRSDVERLGNVYPERPDFHLLFIRHQKGWGFAVKEEVSGAVVPIFIGL